MSTVTGRVARGAALLDEKRPGWWRDIDLARLDLRYGCTCIVGQVEHLEDEEDYTDALAALGLEHEWTEGDYGFDATSVYEFDEQLGDLAAAWRELITLRRESAP